MNVEKILRPFAGKKSLSRFWWKVYRASLIGMNAGSGAAVENSGETYTLSYLKQNIIRQKNPVLFDVGANTGDYAAQLLEIFPDCSLYCFEPAPFTFHLLSQNIQKSNVVLNQTGISDFCSESVLFFDRDHTGLASLYERQCVNHSEEVAIQLDTIDHYCQENHISHIHFLKMDIEGNELKALSGARQMLQRQEIDAVQIEFGGCNIDSRTFFRDFWNLLHENYFVYRVLKDGLYPIEDYLEILEIFTCTNYLFISKALKS